MNPENQQNLATKIFTNNRISKNITLDFSFLDLSGHQIDLTFDNTKFSTHPHDILVFGFYQNYLVMTKHKTRGVELPGGKINYQEEPIKAVFRETWEETGGIINSVQQIGEYIIREYEGKDRIKAIYYGIITNFTNLPEGFETDGFELLSLPVNTQQPGFSPLLRDDVFDLTIHYLESLNLHPFANN